MNLHDVMKEYSDWLMTYGRYHANRWLVDILGDEEEGQILFQHITASYDDQGNVEGCEEKEPEISQSPQQILVSMLDKMTSAVEEARKALQD